MTQEIRPGWTYDPEHDRFHVHGVPIDGEFIDQAITGLGTEWSRWMRFRRDGDQILVEPMPEDEMVTL
jgi:hypothetical protein